MKKSNTAILIILVVSTPFFKACQQHEQTPVAYNEERLKSFVLNSNSNEKFSLASLDSIIKTISTDSTVFRQTIAYLEKPFGDPNSIYRNEQLYSKLLEAKMASPWFSPYEKTVAKQRIRLLQQNRVGAPANDFTYTTPAGYKKKVYDTKAHFVLLYFNNPECNACKEMKEALTASSVIKQKIKTGALKILSIYTDRDEKLWLDHLTEFPAEWIQGRDENEYLYKNNIYDLRAIPTVYLLDKDKRVLFKDCVDVEEIEKLLRKFEEQKATTGKAKIHSVK